MRTKYAIFIASFFVVLLLLVAPSSALDATQPQSVTLNPSKGQEINFVYEAFLSPQQEPGEEEDTPRFTPKQFLSTAPSVPRNERKSRGHGIVKFSSDLSKAYVEVKAENVNPQDIVMFHIQAQQQLMDRAFAEIHNRPLQLLAFLLRELQVREVSQQELKDVQLKPLNDFLILHVVVSPMTQSPQLN